VINKEEDIAAYTIKAVDDPRTLNKILYIKPSNNTLSMNEIVTLWEKKIGKSLEKTHLPEEQLLKSIQGLDNQFTKRFLDSLLITHSELNDYLLAESPIPINVVLSINHAVFVNGDTNISIEPSFGVEASELYPDVKYTSVDEYLSYFA